MEQSSENDLWFLPGPKEDEPDYLPPGPRAELRETKVLDDWRKAEAGSAARLARACVGFHFWNLASLVQQGHRMEVAVTAARIAASEGTFASDWKEEHVHRHLAQTRGILQGDGYKGNAKLYEADTLSAPQPAIPSPSQPTTAQPT